MIWKPLGFPFLEKGILTEGFTKLKELEDEAKKNLLLN